MVEPIKYEYIHTNKLTITTGLTIYVKAPSNIKGKETKGNKGIHAWRYKNYN